MIDSHTHTFYSKHAVGTVDELVRAAISKGIEILTITDHAPFYVDRENRLLCKELDLYFTDIEHAQQRYKGTIKILKGLEFDYMQGACDYTTDVLSRYDLDFAIGSVHYIPISSDNQVKVWDLPRLADKSVLRKYFEALSEAIECELFDAIGHADTLLRGVSDSVLHEYFEPLLLLFNRHRVAFELNTSGLRKTTLDQQSKQEVAGLWSYPSLSLIPMLIDKGTNFTIGSDAHAPSDVGAGVKEIVDAFIPLGLKHISYFEKRQRVDIPAQLLLQRLRNRCADTQ